MDFSIMFTHTNFDSKKILTSKNLLFLQQDWLLHTNGNQQWHQKHQSILSWTETNMLKMIKKMFWRANDTNIKFAFPQKNIQKRLK